MKSFSYRGQIITAETKQDAIAQIITAAKANTIKTRLKGRENKVLVENVLDNMPDSKTDGCEVALVGKDVVLKVPQDNDYFTKEKACFHIAKNMKRIVKKSFAWNRSNNKVVKDLSTSKFKFTVSDCYAAYDLLLNRKTEKFEYNGDESFRPEYTKAIVKECKQLPIKPKINIKNEKEITTIELSFDKLAHAWGKERKPHIPSIKIYLYNNDPDNEEIQDKKFRKMQINYAGLVLSGPDYSYYCGYDERSKLKSPEGAAKTCARLIKDMFKVYKASVEYDDLRKKSKLKENKDNEKLKYELRTKGEELEELDELVSKWDNR